MAAAVKDMAAQISQCAALTDEVIHQNVLSTRFHLTFEGRLPRQPAPAISPLYG